VAAAGTARACWGCVVAKAKFVFSPEFKRMRKNLRWLASVELVIGILGDSAFYVDEDGFTLVDAAIVNEFGSDDGHIPERAAHRTTFREQKASMDRRMLGITRLVVEGRDPKPLMEKLGLFYVSKLRQQVIAWDNPPNAASTVRIKGANNPLVDTGRTLNSIQHLIRKRSKDGGTVR
jgi:hypothetical protein